MVSNLIMILNFLSYVFLLYFMLKFYLWSFFNNFMMRKPALD